MKFTDQALSYSGGENLGSINRGFRAKNKLDAINDKATT